MTPQDSKCLEPPPEGAKGDLTTGSITRHIFTFGLPLVVAMIFHALFNIVDIYIVGKMSSPDNPNIGSQAMAAVHIASIINISVMVIVNGISVSSIALISRFFGEKRYADANEVARQSLLLMLGLSVVSLFIGMFLTAPLVTLICGENSGPVYEMAYVYNYIMFAGAFTMFFLLQITAVLRAAGQSVWPMILLIGANLLNVILDVFLIFGVWIFPKWGVAGAAWATVIARGAAMLVAFAILFRGNQRITLTLRNLKIDPPSWWRLLKIGMPSTAQLTVRILPMWFLTRMIMDCERRLMGSGVLESEGILSGAFAVGIRVDMLALFGSAGWGAAASTLVGQNLGAKKPDRAAMSTWLTTAYSAGMMLIVAVLCFLFADEVISVFDSNPDVIRLGEEYLQLICFSYIFVATGVVFASALNGAGSTKVPLLFDFLGYGLFQVAVALILTNRTFLGIPFDHRGIYWAIILTNVLVACTYAVWFRMGRWKTITLC